MTIEKLLEKLPPETHCVLTPKKDCDVLTITVPKSDHHRTSVAFNIWLAFCARINANRRAKGMEAQNV